MKVTTRWLEKHKACGEAVRWVKSQPDKDTTILFKELKKSDNLAWGNWYLSKKLKRMDKIRYAIYAAKQVLAIFEKKYPDDKRPRNAIRVAEKYLKNPTGKNKLAAADAAYAADAADAADAAADAKRKMQIKILKYGLKLLRG